MRVTGLLVLLLVLFPLYVDGYPGWLCLIVAGVGTALYLTPTLFGESDASDWLVQ